MTRTGWPVRAAVSAAILGVLHVAMATPGTAGDRQARESREQVIYVSVVNQQGAPVTDLAPDDFIIREDGLRREVLRVQRATERISLALVVDNSQAITPYMLDLRKGLKEFVEQMRPASEIALIGIGERPTILSDYTRDAKQLTGSVDRIFPVSGSGAYLLEALIETATGFERRHPARPVIVAVLTEGPEYSNPHHETVLRAIAAAGARFDALVLTSRRGPDVMSDEERRRAIVLDEGPRAQGGQRQDLITSMALPDRLKQVGDELLTQYKVTYARPESLIPPTKIEAGVGRPGLIARGVPARPPKG